MSVGRICSREVYVAKEDETVQAAAQRMDSEQVGTLVVVDEGSRPLGIITDRDLALRVVAPGRVPATTRVGEVMSGELRTLREDAPVEASVREMAQSGVRRIVVVDHSDRLVGILTFDDVIDLLSEEMAALRPLLRRQQPNLGTSVS